MSRKSSTSFIRRLKLITAAAVLTVSIAACGGAAGAGGGGSNGSTLTISYSEKVGDELPLWIAADAGYFKKNGLNVKLQSVTGKDGVPALLSGQTQIAAIGGSEALSAKSEGADLKYILTLMPTYTFQFYAQPGHTTAATLRGQRVGITSTSGSLYIGTVLALKRLGLKPSDVQLVPLGSVPNVNSALVAGTVVAAASHPPNTYSFEQHNLKKIVDLPEEDIPAAISGFAVQNSYLSQHSDTMNRVVKSILQAIERAKSDKAYTEKEMAKYMGVTDPGEADFTYKFYVDELMPTIPAPSVTQFKDTQASLALKNSKVSGVDLSELVDAQYVDKAAKELGITASPTPTASSG